MQCGQPNCNHGTFSFSTPPFCIGLPVIIGEGNVVSFRFSDGSTHLIFLPINQCSPIQYNNPPLQCNNLPYQCNSPPYQSINSPYQSITPPYQCNSPLYQCNSSNCQSNNSPFSYNAPIYQCSTYPNFPTKNVNGCREMSPTNQGWIVRNVLNSLPQPLYQQPLCSAQSLPFPSMEHNFGDPFPRQTKFHNDCCTSTSDIHYFFPKLRQAWPRPPQCTASMQTSQPKITFTDSKVDTADLPYHVKCKCSQNKKQKAKCECNRGKMNSRSTMSIDNLSDDCSRPSHKKHKRCCKKKHLCRQKPKLKHGSGSVECRCKKQTVGSCMSIETYPESTESKENLCNRCNLKRKLKAKPIKSLLKIPPDYCNSSQEHTDQKPSSHATPVRYIESVNLINSRISQSSQTCFSCSCLSSCTSASEHSL